MLNKEQKQKIINKLKTKRKKEAFTNEDILDVIQLLEDKKEIVNQIIELENRLKTKDDKLKSTILYMCYGGAYCELLGIFKEETEKEKR